MMIEIDWEDLDQGELIKFVRETYSPERVFGVPEPEPVYEDSTCILGFTLYGAAVDCGAVKDIFNNQRILVDEYRKERDLWRAKALELLQ